MRLLRSAPSPYSFFEVRLLNIKARHQSRKGQTVATDTKKKIRLISDAYLKRLTDRAPMWLELALI
jgi:hypothetical protein